MTPFTEQQWWVICDFVSQPTELSEANLEKDFIYDRKYGFMNVLHAGAHEIVQKQLLAFHHDCEDLFDLVQKWNLSDKGVNASRDFPEKWLEISGNAYKSALTEHLRTGYANSLNAQEKIAFKNFQIWPMLEEK